MINNTPQVQTNHCLMCEDAAKKILELEQRVKVLTDGLQKIITNGDYTAPEGMKRIAQETLNQTPQQTAAQIERWHVEWIQQQPIAGYEFSIWDGRKRVEVLAIDYIPQEHPVYGVEEIRGKIPLVAIPPLPKESDSPETEIDKTTRLNG